MGNCAGALKDSDLDDIDRKKLEEEHKSDKPAQDPVIGAYLLKVPLLAKLTEEERGQLGAELVEKNYSDGQKIVQEGEEGREFYIIKEGIAVVSKEDLESKMENILCELKKGDYFGEMALLNNAKRAATIRAKGPVSCLVMDQDKFQKSFGSKVKQKVTFAKRAAISAESYDPQEEKKKKGKIPDGAKMDKTPETREMILGAISQNMLFKNLDRDQQIQIVDVMWLKEVKKGVSIIRQGDLGDNFYVVDKGNFDIFVSTDGKKPVKVATRGKGQSFGELALMYARPRAATVTSTELSNVWVLDRWTFRSLLSQVNEKKLQEYEEFLKKVKSFEALLDYERSKLAAALEMVSYPDGHEIIKQGDEGDTFFIVKKGEVLVLKEENGVRSEVTRYKAGDYFGERALVTNQVRAATVMTVGPVDCLYLDREAFTNLLGPLQEIFEKRVKSYESVSPTRGHGQSTTEQEDDGGFTESGSSTPLTDSKSIQKKYALEDLTVIGTLGKGSFGHVQLVKDKAGDTFALKSVSKAQIVQLGQQEHIMSEKRVMAELDHPTLIKLHATFKDKNCLFFLLEPSLGGELFSVLRGHTFFDEATARFFAASIVLAFEYMHSKGIIYRDLKPENLLLTDKGYLKITDFGFAKKIKDKRTWTLCGTPDYLAPEVVSGQGHDRSVDWWTLGILIYEMLASYPPFYDEDPMKTYAKIMHGQVAFPMHFSKHAVDLIKRLLHPKPTKRLGVLKGGAKLIKTHAWFKNFDWDAFEKQTMKAPIILPVKSKEDLSNFEEYPDEETQWEEYVPDPKNPDWDLDF